MEGVAAALLEAIGPHGVRMLSAAPLAVAFVVMQATVLPMRRRALFVLVQMALFLVLTPLEGAPGVKNLAVMALLVLSPLPFYSAAADARAFVVSACGLAISAGELLSSIVWIAMVGGSLGPDTILAHPGIRLACEMLGTSVIAICCLVFSHMGRNNHRLYPDHAPSALAYYPSTQLLLLIGASSLVSWGLRYSPHALEPLACLGGLLALTIGCLALDARLIVVWRHYQQGMRDKEQMDALMGQFDESLRRYPQLEEEAARFSRMRHDLRNHLQVATVLIERGDYDQARAYLESLEASYGEWEG